MYIKSETHFMLLAFIHREEFSPLALWQVTLQKSVLSVKYISLSLQTLSIQSFIYMLLQVRLVHSTPLLGFVPVPLQSLHLISLGLAFICTASIVTIEPSRALKDDLITIAEHAILK